MTKRELVNRIYDRLKDQKLSKKRIKEFVDSVFEYIQDSLSKGEDVKISGFGTFHRVKRKERKGRNPQTGRLYLIPERFVVSLRLSKKVRYLLTKNPK